MYNKNKYDTEILSSSINRRSAEICNSEPYKANTTLKFETHHNTESLNFDKNE